MSRWWRAYDEAVDDPKLQRLPGELFKAWFNLCCLTSQNGGILPSIDVIAFKLRCSEDKARDTIDRLREKGLIDKADDESLSPHNWAGRQFKSDTSNERVKRLRERRRNVTETVTVTPPETDTDTETEKETPRAAAPRESDWPKDFREQFWAVCPKKVGKLAAMRKLERIRKSGKVPFDLLLNAKKLFAISVKGHDPRFIKHPAKWLEDGCWEDELPEAPAVFASPAAVRHGEVVNGRFFAMRETPQFEAWDRHLVATRGRGPPTTASGGWWFDSEWPPEHTPHPPPEGREERVG